MTDLYLIAHKVRGEAAFDIAIILDILDEDGDPIWIIPTSGHRARPYWTCLLEDCTAPIREHSVRRIHISLLGPMPPDLQDHYHLDQPVAPNQPSLLSRLNLKPAPQPPIVRRI